MFLPLKLKTIYLMRGQGRVPGQRGIESLLGNDKNLNKFHLQKFKKGNDLSLLGKEKVKCVYNGNQLCLRHQRGSMNSVIGNCKSQTCFAVGLEDPGESGENKICS